MCRVSPWMRARQRTHADRIDYAGSGMLMPVYARRHMHAPRRMRMACVLGKKYNERARCARTFAPGRVYA